MLQSYGLALVADKMGWVSVAWLWVTLSVITLALLLVIYPKWKRFVKENEN